MIKRHCFIMPLLLIALSGFAQTDTSVFQNMQKIEAQDAVMPLPEGWKPAEHRDVTAKDLKYEFAGVGLPKEVNGNPVAAYFTMRRYECNGLNAAKDYIVTEITSYPDRVTPKGFNYVKDSMNIQSGEKASLFFTHFYRSSKKLYYSRYDLVAYSKKRKTAYMLTVTFGHKDPTYAIENNLNLKRYALRVFSGLLLR